MPGEQDDDRILWIEIESLDLSAWNSRREELEADDELIRSVERFGILQPVGVRLTKDRGKAYTLVYGFRRVDAARKAGLEVVPARYFSITEDEALAVNLGENYHRKTLRPWELAQAIYEIRERTSLDVKEIAKAVGCSEGYAGQLLKVRTRLAPVIWEQFRTWGITHRVPWEDLVSLCAHPWDEQIERWNLAQDQYQGARRGCEYRPGTAKVRKMLKRLEEHPDVVREGAAFSAGARYALRVVLGLEVWRHGGVLTGRRRRARVRARDLKGKDETQ